MKTDRVIKITDGKDRLTLTDMPYTVQNTSGFDTIDVKHITSQGFRQDGVTLLGSSVSTRNLTIRGQIYAETTQEMERLRLQLLNMFRPKADITITQIFGGYKKSIIARASKTPSIELTDVTCIQNYSVDLTAHMPYWLDPATVVKIADTIGGFHFPVQTPTHFGVKMSSPIAILKNESPDPVGMEIKFIAHGIVDTPKLLNIYTQEYIQINAQMEQNEIITVTTGEKKTVTRYLNGEKTNYLNKIDLAGGGYTFLMLSPGDNVMRASAADGESMLETQMSFNNRFPGM